MCVATYVASCMHVFIVVHVSLFAQNHGLVKALAYPYAVDYYLWAPIELLRRSLFIICVVLSPGNLVSS